MTLFSSECTHSRDQHTFCDKSRRTQLGIQEELCTMNVCRTIRFARFLLIIRSHHPLKKLPAARIALDFVNVNISLGRGLGFLNKKASTNLREKQIPQSCLWGRTFQIESQFMLHAEEKTTLVSGAH